MQPKGKTMLRKQSYLISLFFFFTLNTVTAESVPCESKFNSFLKTNLKLSAPAKINAWKREKGKCNPKGYYYYGLAKLHNSYENIKEAKKNIKLGLKHNDSAHKLNQLMALSVAFTEQSFKPLNNSGWSKLEKRIITFTEKHQNLIEGYTLLSSVKLARGDYNGAIQYAGKSAYLEGGLSFETGRTLSIAYTEVKKYKQAVEVGNGASKLYNELFLDKYFMLAMVRSYYGSGNLDMASRILKLLVTKNPKIINDNDVQKYARFLQGKLKEREKK